MKAEEKIIELLAEYLQKTDRLLERMERTDKNMERTYKNMERTDKNMERTDRNVNIMSKAILDHSSKFEQVNGEIRKLREDQGVMLKELLFISRRVSSLEDKG